MTGITIPSVSHNKRDSRTEWQVRWLGFRGRFSQLTILIVGYYDLRIVLYPEEIVNSMEDDFGVATSRPELTARNNGVDRRIC